jgi:amino acid efflux transporter
MAEMADTTMASSNSGLRKEVTMRHAVALYMSSVLGSGILILPGLAAQIAGPASLIAWAILSLASYPLAYTFATLSSRRPESGGVYSFAKESFGPRAANAVAWLFILWDIAGAPAVMIIAASYLAYALPLSRTLVYLVAGLLLIGTFAVNYRGILVSSRVQMILIAAITSLLVVAVAASSLLIRPENFQPFLPHGILPIGTAAALIFWSYLGYENVSNVAEEFKNPQRDFHRSIVLSVLLISVLYFSVALTTVGTRAYESGGSVAPFAAMLSNALGAYGAITTGILAVVIIFGTVNAYQTGMSRVVYAAAKQGGLPKTIAQLDEKTGVPKNSLLLLISLSLVVLTLFYFFNVDLQTALLIPSGAAILIYIAGAAAGVKIMSGNRKKRIFPWVSLILSIAMLPFVGVLLLAAIPFALLGALYKRNQTGLT